MAGPLPGVLYITYDGVLEPLGESQVVAYLVPLARDYRITLLSFERPADLARQEAVARIRGRLDAAGIRWRVLRYHRRPPLVSTAYDLARGTLAVLRPTLRGEFRLVHARSYVPSVIALAVKALGRAAFLFDMRGFWIDERADIGQWPRGGVLYRLVKRFERRFFAAADGVVSLTRRGVEAFPRLGSQPRPDARVAVIPTCADLDRFQPRTSLGRAPRAPVVGCVGTLSNWYLRDETLGYLGWLARRLPAATFLIVTRDDHARLRADAVAAGVPDDRLTIRRAGFDEMPELVRSMDVGVFFIRPCFSKLASAATKLAEFLASGVPVVINDGIGDSGDFVRAHGVGVVLPEAAPGLFEASWAPLTDLLADAATRERCRRAAEAFSLARGVESYRGLYRALVAEGASGASGPAQVA